MGSVLPRYITSGEDVGPWFVVIFLVCVAGGAVLTWLEGYLNRRDQRKRR